jgi:hypothetical protein
MPQHAAGLTRATPAEPAAWPDPPMGRTLGLARLSRAVQDPEALQPLWEELKARALGQPTDPGALLDLGVLLLATGARDQGLEVQAAAITEQTLYVRPAERPRTLRLLAFMRHGDFMANTPLDFLLEGSGVELVQCYIDAPPSPGDVPDHDLAFLAIGEGAEVAPLLASLEGAFDAWPRPVLNGRPALISALTRDGVCERLASCDGLLSPAVRRATRQDLARVAAGAAPSSVLGAGCDFPFIVRPCGTHAGIGMEKIGSAAELEAYLPTQAEDAFYVTDFVDYAGRDGLFRKYRVVFIGGRPFLSHMAVSPRWMVHYLNAEMAENAANRAEEAQAMATFDSGFAARHAEAFRRLCEIYPFDYFGIDCAETQDGRLLLFEADVALIVHAMDPEELYPYKKPAMAKLFAAFVAMLEARALAAA